MTAVRLVDIHQPLTLEVWCGRGEGADSHPSQDKGNEENCTTKTVPQSISVRLSATPWTAALQASLSITNSRSLLKLMSIEYYDVEWGETISKSPMLYDSVYM